MACTTSRELGAATEPTSGCGRGARTFPNPLKGGPGGDEQGNLLIALALKRERPVESHEPFRMSHRCLRDVWRGSHWPGTANPRDKGRRGGPLSLGSDSRADGYDCVPCGSGGGVPSGVASAAISMATKKNTPSR